MYILKVKMGPGRGATWTISEQPLTIGRERTCEVRIADPLVSRQHCRITLEDGEIRLTDLGSRNTTMVNGKPVSACVLDVGDEIVIGQITLAVDEGERDNSRAPRSVGGNTTVSLGEGESIWLNESNLQDFEKSGFTVSDVVQLFRYSRVFSRLTSLTELIDTMEAGVAERLKPVRLWIAMVEPVSGTLKYRVQRADQAVTSSPPPENAIRQALKELCGLLVPERVVVGDHSAMRVSLVVPIQFGQQPIGVVVAQQESPESGYNEKDLHFLVALAHAVAPFFGAIEKLESLEREIEWLRVARHPASALIGESAGMLRVREQAFLVADSPTPVLIIGETGTGKELVARLLHERSRRASGPLVTVNCAAIPQDLIESELFGYEKGAFTGANDRHIGLFEQSHGGTLFLDEVGDLSPESQARILRAIETKRFRRVGGKQEIEADFRIVSATNKDISSETYSMAFRRDLYHRLRGVEIRIPALRDRKTDIQPLAEHFLRQAHALAKHPLRGFAPDAMEFLQSRSWPGNVRELKNCIEAAVAFSSSELITGDDLRLVTGGPDAPERPLPLDEMEKRHILWAIDYCGGRTLDAAKVLGIGKSKLYERIAAYRAQGLIID